MNINDFIKNKKAEMTNDSRVIAGKVKMQVEDVIGRWPEGFHVIQYDIIESKEYGILVPIVVAEDTSTFSYAPKMLRDMLIEMHEVCFNKDFLVADIKLKEIGGVPVKYSRKTSRNTGNEYTLVEILDN